MSKSASCLAVVIVLVGVGAVFSAEEARPARMGPTPTPPAGDPRPTPQSVPTTAVFLYNVPSSAWWYGCSATSAGMMFGYYDRTGYGNMYTGPTSDPETPSGSASGMAPRYNLAQTYLIATKNAHDGGTGSLHVDDYWISYGATGPDPWVSASRPEHTWGDCTADYMGTNQWKWDFQTPVGTVDFNWDGSTALFTNYSGGVPSPTKLYDYIPPIGQCLGPPTPCPQTALCHGLKLFAESRSYSVKQITDPTQGTQPRNFTQFIDAQATGGFSFNDYKAEIDAGRPVMVQVHEHSMVGVGYDTVTPDLMYIYDTWDDLLHTMYWGGSYSGRQHEAMTVIELDPVQDSRPVADANGPYTGNVGDFILFDSSGSSDPDSDTISGWLWDVDYDRRDENGVLGSVEYYTQSPSFQIPASWVVGSTHPVALCVFANGAWSKSDLAWITVTGTGPAIPEPSTIVLLSLGLVGFVTWSRRRRR